MTPGAGCDVKSGGACRGAVMNKGKIAAAVGAAVVAVSLAVWRHHKTRHARAAAG